MSKKKALCVSNELVGLSLNIGEWYDVAETGYKDGCYIVYDIKNGIRHRGSKLSKKYFKTIEEVRDEKLKELGI